MNPYDKAYELAAAVKESDEMKRLVAAADELRGNDSAWGLVREYLTEQMKVDYGRMAGKEPEESVLTHLQELSVMVSNSGAAQAYLQAFLRWQQVAADLQKIVNDAILQGTEVLELEKK